ncbi:unnamed protein product [Plutella xylostella]|uniref:(diamondback moth) hypothetical protein n=1 Tax=Plutella xylostella TaxID=51655 RepID=A0A8S4EHT4_PLUXY|nr:unnamed protein product [Plutella xylostella]
MWTSFLVLLTLATNINLCLGYCNGDPNGISGCGDNCNRLCDDLVRPFKRDYCPKKCKINGCDCKVGFYYDQVARKCVSPENCTGICDVNEEISTCKNNLCRPQNCIDKGKPFKCDGDFEQKCCSIGCVCKSGYLRSADGICINEAQCNAEQCGVNEEFSTCSNSVCRLQNCTQRGLKLSCTEITKNKCVRSCICKNNYLRARNGSCIPESGCEADGSIPTCGLNEEYSACSNAICQPEYCVDRGKPITCVGVPRENCTSGCVCAKYYLRNNNGQCVLEDKCEKTNALTTTTVSSGSSNSSQNVTSPPTTPSSSSSNSINTSSSDPRNNASSPSIETSTPSTINASSDPGSTTSKITTANASSPASNITESSTTNSQPSEQTKANSSSISQSTTSRTNVPSTNATSIPSTQSTLQPTGSTASTSVTATRPGSSSSKTTISSTLSTKSPSSTSRPITRPPPTTTKRPTNPTSRSTSRKPTVASTSKPTKSTIKPTSKPTAKPTTKATTKPTSKPTGKPTPKPTRPPSTIRPTTKSTGPSTSKRPTAKPTVAPTTVRSTAKPTVKPTAKPTADPTPVRSTAKPTVAPTTIRSTVKPTVATTTIRPTTKPTVAPTTVRSTAKPTVAPTTIRSTVKPTTAPTARTTPCTTCEENEEYLECANTVCRPQTCSEVGKELICPNDLKSNECEAGCVCKQGYVRSQSLKCIPECDC